MASVRKRRKALGLVQMNVWIEEADKKAFLAAIAPFQAVARDIEHLARENALKIIPTGYRLSFSVAPPATVRNTMKASGWHYDRVANVWNVKVDKATDEARLKEVCDLEINHGATVEHEWH